MAALYKDREGRLRVPLLCSGVGWSRSARGCSAVRRGHGLRREVLRGRGRPEVQGVARSAALEAMEALLLKVTHHGVHEPSRSVAVGSSRQPGRYGNREGPGPKLPYPAFSPPTERHTFQRPWHTSRIAPRHVLLSHPRINVVSASELAGETGLIEHYASAKAITGRRLYQQKGWVSLFVRRVRFMVSLR